MALFGKIKILNFGLYEKGRLILPAVCKRSVTNNPTTTSTDNNDNILELQDDKVQKNEEEIEQIRNKSKLKQEHRNILFNTKPYSEPMIEAHLTVKYNRKMYGKYGSESGVNPGIMWPTKKDLEERREYESVAYPFTIQEMVASALREKEAKELEIKRKHDKVVANYAKLDIWKKELSEKIAKREADAMAAKQKKEKLIEEVRRHFGFTVDPRDERFKEMIAIKEKEQRKREKEARMQERERKAIAKLMSKHNISSTDSSEKSNQN